jgi:hypothetical protein
VTPELPAGRPAGGFEVRDGRPEPGPPAPVARTGTDPKGHGASLAGRDVRDPDAAVDRAADQSPRAADACADLARESVTAVAHSGTNHEDTTGPTSPP